MAERTTSFAKSIEGLHQEDSALDHARSLRDQFAHVQEQNNQPQKPREAERPREETEKSGSQTVRQDAPVMRPTPTGPMRQLDRQAAYGKVAKERTGEDRKLEALKMAQEFRERQAQAQKEHGHERERDR